MKKDSRGVWVQWGMLPRKFFENLPVAVAILLLFDQFLGYYFLPLNLNVSPMMMPFVPTFSIVKRA